MFTYYVRDVPKTLKEKRKELEDSLFKKGVAIPQPSEADLRTEKSELDPFLTFTVTDDQGNPVRIIRKNASKGINRVNWDLRYQSTRFVEAGEKFDPVSDNGSGVLAVPGKYKVTLTMTAGGTTRTLAGPVEFNAVALANTTLPAEDRAAMTAFHRKVAELTRVMQGTESYAEGLTARINGILQALNSTPGVSPELVKKAMDVKSQLDEILNVRFNRQSNKPSDEENPPAPVPLNDRLYKVSWITWITTGTPTATQMDAYRILETEFPPVYGQVKKLGETDIPGIEKAMEQLGAPPTPGRLPEWRK